MPFVKEQNMRPTGAEATVPDEGFEYELERHLNDIPFTNIDLFAYVSLPVCLSMFEQMRVHGYSIVSVHCIDPTSCLLFVTFYLKWTKDR